MSPSPADELILTETRDRAEITMLDIRGQIINLVMDNYSIVTNDPDFELGEVLEQCNGFIREFNKTGNAKSVVEFSECEDKLERALMIEIFEYALE